MSNAALTASTAVHEPIPTPELGPRDVLVYVMAAGVNYNNVWAAMGIPVDVIKARQNPTIVFEHPGETTLPTSCFMCETGGMIVICAGTTGYNATLDLRYHWMRQKRLQGSHFANDDQARGANDLVTAGKVDPCLSRVFPFAETAECHQLMRDNLHPSGNMAILVNAPRPGLRTLAEVRAEPLR